MHLQILNFKTNLRIPFQYNIIYVIYPNHLDSYSPVCYGNMYAIAICCLRYLCFYPLPVDPLSDTMAVFCTAAVVHGQLLHPNTAGLLGYD